MLEELANSMIDETVSELKQKAKKAMHGAEIKTQKKLMQIIEKDMLENYYAGYSPMYYRRTFQLDKSVTPKTRLNESQKEKVQAKTMARQRKKNRSSTPFAIEDILHQ